jgi:hypothetical protein
MIAAVWTVKPEAARAVAMTIFLLNTKEIKYMKAAKK